MAAVNDQRELADEIADTLASPYASFGTGIDDVCSPRAYPPSIITDLSFSRRS